MKSRLTKKEIDKAVEAYRGLLNKINDDLFAGDKN